MNIKKLRQDREIELIEIIKDTINPKKTKKSYKTKITDFQRYIDRGGFY